jgi:hypothetical protein
MRIMSTLKVPRIIVLFILLTGLLAIPASNAQAGDGTNLFAAAVNYGAGTTLRSVATGDFNRDGKLDVAIANFGSNDVSILLGVGDGTFAAAGN